MTRKGKSAPNYLDNVPVQRVGHEVGENGLLILLRPKFMRGPLAWWLQPRLRSRHFRVKLDEIGSAAWPLIDGKRTILEISDLIYEKLGDRVEPRYERVSRFIGELRRGGMVAFV